MKVLLTAGAIDGGKSGVGRYVIELARALTRGFPDLDLHVAGLDRDRLLFSFLDRQRWISVPAGAAKAVKSLLWHQTALPGILKKGEFDLLHTPTYRRIVRFCPVPQVATIHDCAPFMMTDKYDPLRGLFGRKIVPDLARRCERIIAVSHATAGHLETFMGLDPSRIETIWNGIDHRQYRPRPESEVQQFLQRQEQRHPYFLYIARFEHPGKNHIGLVEAYERFRASNPEQQTDLVLGGADWHGAVDIHRRIARSPFRQDIRTLGFVPEEDLPLWYAGCLALVIPSFFEGFGLPVIEAYASGAAVALSGAGSLREVGGEGAMYFDPHQPEEMVDCLVRLAAEPPAGREKRREENLSWAARFSWDQCAKQVFGVYGKII